MGLSHLVFNLQSLLAAIVVTVPDEPRYFKAPASQYKRPPPDIFDVGAVVQFAIKKT